MRKVWPWWTARAWDDGVGKSKLSPGDYKAAVARDWPDVPALRPNAFISPRRRMSRGDGETGPGDFFTFLYPADQKLGDGKEKPDRLERGAKDMSLHAASVGVPVDNTGSPLSPGGRGLDACARKEDRKMVSKV